MEDSKKSFRMSGKKEKAEQAIKTDSSDPSKMSKNEARKKIYELEEKLTELRSLLIAEQGRSKELEEIVKAKDLKLRKMQIGEDADNVDSSLAIFHPLSKKGEYTEFYSFDEEDTDDNIIYLDIKSDLVESSNSKNSSAVSFLLRTMRQVAEPRDLSINSSSLNSIRQTETFAPNLTIQCLEGYGMLEGKEDIVILAYVTENTNSIDIVKQSGKSKIRFTRRKSTDFLQEKLHLYIPFQSQQYLRVELWNSDESALLSHSLLPLQVFWNTTNIPIRKDIWLNFSGTPTTLHVILGYSPVTKAQLNLKAATILKLIEKIAPVEKRNRDLNFITEFLLIYRLFLSPKQLFDSLTKRYNGPPRDNYPETEKFQRTLIALQRNVSYLFHNWVERTTDFSVEEPLHAEALSWFKSIELPNKYIIACIKKLEGSHFIRRNTLKNLSDPSRATLSGSQVMKVHFSDLNDPTGVADQITLMEYELLKAVRPYEFLKQAWSKKDGEQRAPNIHNYVKWFNKVSRWVSTEIIKGATPAERSVIIGKFIDVAMQLKERFNYNGVMEIICSLHSVAVQRLKRSWALIPNNLMDRLDELTQLLSPNDNFKHYREAISTAPSTCIPYLGLWLTDLTFIDDGNPDTTENGLIYYEKASMVAKRIRELEDCLLKPYDFKPQPSVKETRVWEENDLFRLSKLKEEKTNTDDEGLPMRFDSKTFAKIAKSILNGKENVSTDSGKLTHRDWHLLLSLATIVSCKNNQVIVTQGIPSNSLYRIKQGTVRVVKTTEQNGVSQDTVISTMEQPQMFGEMSILGQYGAASASVIGNDDTVLLYRMEMQSVQQLMEREFGLATRFYSKLAQRLAEILLSINPKTSSWTGMSKDDSTKQEHKSDSLDKVLEVKFGLTGSVVLKRTCDDYKATLKKRGYGLSSYGTLYITESNICFRGKTFGRTVKEVLSYKDLSDLSSTGSDLTLTFGNHDLKLSFKTEQDTEDASYMIKSLSSKHKSAEKPPLLRGMSVNSSVAAQENDSETVPSKIYKVLSKGEWDLILKGAKTMTLKQGDIIIAQGEEYQRIYQISKGICRIEVRLEHKTVVLGKMVQGETFGEMSFLIPNRTQGAYGSVIADTEEVDLVIIEGYYINALFNINPEFAGHFYKYLCYSLAHRIKQRQTEKPQ